MRASHKERQHREVYCKSIEKQHGLVEEALPLSVALPSITAQIFCANRQMDTFGTRDHSKRGKKSVQSPLSRGEATSTTVSRNTIIVNVVSMSGWPPTGYL